MLEVPPIEEEQTPEERDTLTEQIGAGFESGGLGGAITGGLRGLGEMFLPQAGLPGQRDFGSILRDIVEFSRVGDVMDVFSALDPNSGLDPVERAIAALPIVGAGGLGAHMTRKKFRARFENRMTQPVFAQSMLPPPGYTPDFRQTFDELGGVQPTPEQNRQQRARFEQLELERKSPFIQAALQAQSWDELDQLAGPGLPRELGQAVIAASPNPIDTYGEGEAGQFVAAQWALAKWRRAEQLGIVEDLDLEMLGPILSTRPDSRTLAVERIRDFEIMTTAMGLGPDLVMGTPARFLGIGKTESGDSYGFYGIVDELLPTERLYNWDEARPFVENGTAVKARIARVDYESLVGLFASNTAKGAVEGARSHTEDGWPAWDADKTQWYRRMNLTAQKLADEAGISVKQSSGVLAALSASAKWVPNNLVGAVHIILQTNRPDLVPGTPEYNRIFHEATLGAGWGNDLYEATGAELRQQFDTAEDPIRATVDFYADPANITSESGNIRGLEKTKEREKVELILKAHLPPWLVLRMMKTNTFHLLGADPGLADLATIDTWNDRGAFGTAWIDNPQNTPLVHQGTQALTQGQIQPNETYVDPITGAEISGAEVIERLDSMKDHGWTQKQIDGWKRTLANFPNRKQISRYLTQQRALQLVRDELGLETAHEAQAASWTQFRILDPGTLKKRLKGARTVDEIHEIASRATFDSTIYSIVEGNPIMERTAAGHVASASPTLKGFDPSEAELEAAASFAQRDTSDQVSVSIVTKADRDGTIVPYADLRTPGVRETLRHATPSGIKVGRFERYIANSPLKVKSVSERIAGAASYLREDGRYAAGYATMGFDPESPGHPGMIPGDRLVVLVPHDRVGDVDAILKSQALVETRKTQVQGQRLAASRNKIRGRDIAGLSPAQVGELLNSVDWYAIASEDMKTLRADIKAAGGEAIPMVGYYGGVEEASFLVTGLDVDTMIALGARHNQEAVAARIGMLYTDGRGTYHEPVGKIRFGDDVDADGNSRLPNGIRFSIDYNWDEEIPYPEVADTLTDTGPAPEPMTQVVVDLDGLFGRMNWNETDRLLRSLGAIPGARTRLYTHAPNKVPGNYARASESVFIDDAGAVGSILHRNGDLYARHHADVYIPAWEMLTLSPDGFGAERIRRNAVETRSILSIDQETGAISLDGDLTIQTNPDDNITIAPEGPIFQSLRVNGQKVTELLIDTTGSHPVMVIGANNIPAPGRTVVELSNGRVRTIRPHTETDLAGARDALASAGLIPDGKSVNIIYPERGTGTFQPTGRFVLDTGETTLEKLPDVFAATPTTQEDIELGDSIRAAGIDIPAIRLGPNAHPDLRRQLSRVLLAVHGKGSLKLPGVERFGPLPTEIWDGTFGIETIDVIDQPEAMAITPMFEAPQPGIILNELHVYATFSESFFEDYGYSDDRYSMFEMTLIHEIGHLMTSRNLTIQETMMKAIEARERMGDAVIHKLLGPYALYNQSEFLAEAFAHVMTNANPHPALVELMRPLFR